MLYFLVKLLKVVKHGRIRDRVSQTLLSLVRRERQGEVVDRYTVCCSYTVEHRFNQKQHSISSNSATRFILVSNYSQLTDLCFLKDVVSKRNKKTQINRTNSFSDTRFFKTTRNNKKKKCPWTDYSGKYLADLSVNG